MHLHRITLEILIRRRNIRMTRLITRHHNPLSIRQITNARILQRIKLIRRRPPQRTTHLQPLITKPPTLNPLRTRTEIPRTKQILTRSMSKHTQSIHQTKHIRIHRHRSIPTVLRVLTTQHHLHLPHPEITNAKISQLLRTNKRVILQHASQQIMRMTLTQIITQHPQILPRKSITLLRLLRQSLNPLHRIFSHKTLLHQPGTKRRQPHPIIVPRQSRNITVKQNIIQKIHKHIHRQLINIHHRTHPVSLQPFPPHLQIRQLPVPRILLQHPRPHQLLLIPNIILQTLRIKRIMPRLRGLFRPHIPPMRQTIRNLHNQLTRPATPVPHRSNTIQMILLPSHTSLHRIIAKKIHKPLLTLMKAGQRIRSYTIHGSPIFFDFGHFFYYVHPPRAHTKLSTFCLHLKSKLEITHCLQVCYLKFSRRERDSNPRCLSARQFSRLL